MRKNDLIETAEPAIIKSNIEQLDPNLAIPYTLKVEPNRAKPRKDIVEPKFKKSRILIGLERPIRTSLPNTDKALPNLTVFRTDKELPISTQSNTDKLLPNLPCEKALKVDPILM